MRRVVTAAARGLADVLTAPLLIAGAFLITLAAAAPFAAIVDRQLRTALADQPPIALGSGEIDADWWSEFRDHAEGLAATFTPTVIGVAAPLDNLSALLDGTRRPLVLLGPILVALVVWAWFWGAALTRLHARESGARSLLAAGFALWPRFLVISLVAALVQLLLYLTVHPLLFTITYEAAVGDATPEPTAFAIRVALYAVFGLLIGTVSLVASYARIAQVVTRPPSAGAALLAGLQFVRGRYATVLSLWALTGVVFVAVLVIYGVVEGYGGARVGGWRGVALAQAYILARLTLRLTNAAAELRLFKAASA